MIVYKGRLLKKSSNQNQSSSCQRWSLHGFQTFHSICDLFGCKLWLLSIHNHADSRLTLFPSFCAPPSEVSVLFNSNLSKRPFLWQVVDLDLLLCTGFNLEHEVSLLCHIFTQRPVTDRKIERSYGRCFGRQQLLAKSIKNFISYEKQKLLVAARNSQSIETFLTFELSQFCKSGSMFSSSDPVAAAGGCR